MAEENTSYRLTNLDASFLYQESAISQMHGGAIFFLRGELAFDKFFGQKSADGFDPAQTGSKRVR